MKRIFTTFSVLILATLAFGQSHESVLLQWKLQPKEVITYKTVMVEIDTANYKEFNFSGLAKLFGDSSNNHSEEMQKIFSKINKSLTNIDMITTLARNKAGNIDIEMKYKKREGVRDSIVAQDDTLGKILKSVNELQQVMQANVALRGIIDDKGEIKILC